MDSQQQQTRSSRASSTSSLGREVRCACQYYRSDSLLPERSALAAQLPKARSPQAMTPPAARRQQYHQQPRAHTREATAAHPDPSHQQDSDAMVQAKKYYRGSERSRKAPVVQISDTDRVDDSSDSLELDRKRTAELVAEDVYIPCDGQVEDVLMDAERLGEQNSDNTVDEDAVLRQAQQLGGAKGFFKNQAGKIKTSFRSMHRPSFSLPRKKKTEKPPQSQAIPSPEEAKPVSLSQPSSPKMEKASRMERFRMALPERIPKPKFNLPDRSKFHMKKPNIHLPASLTRSRKTVHSDHLDQENLPPAPGGDEKAPSRSIFDFATFPRPKKLFEKRQRQNENQNQASDASYVTSTPKDERSSISAEEQIMNNGNTLPRVKKKASLSLSARWAQRFSETTKDPRGVEDEHVLERTTPWGHPSLEKPRLSLTGIKTPEGSQNNLEMGKLPWERQTISERIYDLDVEEGPRPSEEPGIGTGAPMEIVVGKDAGSETVVDPKLRDEEELGRIEARDEMKKLAERTVYVIDAEEKRPLPEEEDEEVEEEIDFDKFFPPVDPIDFERRGHSLELSDDESMRSDREIQQSSGSSCERRRRGDIGEPTKDRFKFISDIKEALRSRKSPHRKGNKEAERRSLPPKKPARSPGSIQNIKASQETHRIVYQAESSPQDQRMEEEPLDDIVVVKPVRRKSRTELSRVSGTEDNILLTPIDQRKAPPVPCRRKRLRREQSSSLSIKTFDSATFNGFVDARESQASSHEMLPDTPASGRRFRKKDDENDRPPIPPKRRSRSRGTSLIPDDDRTSRGAESLPELAFEDEALTPRSSSGEPSLPGYAVIEKKDRPPRLPPPRRKSRPSSGRFATVPRRPKPISPSRVSLDSVPFADDDVTPPSQHHHHHHHYLVDGEVVSKMRDRPLPAPPRPPRAKRDRRLFLRRDITPELSEAAASTQTDPLPDDLAIEEFMEDDGAEVTTAKLTVTPTRSGSLVKISTERIPSPTSSTTPPIPPLPSKLRDFEKRNLEPQSKDHMVNQPPMMPTSEQLSMLRSALLSTEEPLKIQSLEVSDLKVDRLTVSQLEAYKVTASEIEAIVVQATELSNKGDTDSSLHPSLLQELIAIRNHLENVTQSHSRPASVMEDACTGTSDDRFSDDFLEHERHLHERALVRETSPFLQIQLSPAGKEATSEMGRTMLPSSASNPDLTRIPDTGSTAEPMVVTKEPIEKPTAAPAERDRSRSVSPGRGIPGVVRQTASPVKSLPPVISVTPDIPDTPLRHVTSTGEKPQRATVSYASDTEDKPSANPSKDLPSSSRDHSRVVHSRESSRSPPRLLRESSQSPPLFIDNRPSSSSHQSTNNVTQFIAFPTSQIPPEFFSQSNNRPSSTIPMSGQQIDIDSNISETTLQLMRALKIAGSRSLRNFIDNTVSRFGNEDAAKVRQVEIAICALLILVAGLIIIAICTPRTVTHHHHWDYFNPPQ